METLKSYRGYAMTYDESTDKFKAVAAGDGNTLTSDSLRTLKAAIDRAGEEPKVKQPQQAAFRVFHEGEGRYRVSQVRVGAFGVKARSGYYAGRLYAWVTGSGGRERIHINSGYGSAEYVENTPASQAVIDRMNAITERTKNMLKSAQLEQAALLEQLTQVSPKVPVEQLPVWD